MPALPNNYRNQIICGDALAVLQKLPDECIDCVITSPPYWKLRDYGVSGQLGLEATPEDYLTKLWAIFAEVKRVLKPGGTCWVNLGDTYFTNKGASGAFKHRPNQANKYQLGQYSFLGGQKKSLCQIPGRFALGMTQRGWLLRNEIIWHKPNVTPSRVRDRFTNDFEKLFFFTKSQRYYFAQQFEPLKCPERLTRPLFNPNTKRKYQYGNAFTSSLNPKTAEAARQRMLERGRQKRCVWLIPTRPSKVNHFATYPPKLIETPIKAGCPAGGLVLDPFIGSGTTALVARELEREFLGIELNQEYVAICRQRLASG